MATAGAAEDEKEEESWWESCDSSDAVTHDLEDLVKVLRADGDLVLDDSCKLSLSASLLRRINVLQQGRRRRRRREEIRCVDFLCDFMRRTRALKLCGGTTDDDDDEFVDLRLFVNLRLLELHRLSVLSVRGLEALRSQLEYVKCVRIVDGGGGGSGLREMLEAPGCDWPSLRGAIFRHSRLERLDESLLLAPRLESLDVSHNRIADVLCPPGLKHLNLANNRISSLKTFKLTADLQVLVLRNNLIDDIEQLSGLEGLRELDLRCNCLCDFDSLLPLSEMPSLRRLSLLGNPLSCDPDYRSKTCRYLSVRTASSTAPDDHRHPLLLDERRLNVRELRSVGNRRRVGGRTAQPYVDYSTERGGSLQIAAAAAAPLLLIDQMQDSGFVADQRHIAASPPSCCSIGSVGSSLLDDDDDDESNILALRTVVVSSGRYSGSDIEILSNPSQSSSIEVLQPSSNLQTNHINWRR